MSGLDIEGVLAAHAGYEWWPMTREFICTCEVSLGKSYPDPAHRAHVAAVLREQIAAAQAEAWDACAAWVDENDPGWGEDVRDANPYRAALVACVDPSRSESGSTDPEVRQSADRTSSPSRVPGEET